LKTLTFRVELPEAPGVRLTGFRLNDVLGPEDDTEADRLTVPLNPFTLVRTMLNVPVERCGMVIDEGLPEIEKSEVLPTVTWTVVEWEMALLVPETVTV
jgi:hypothetical protein